MLQADAIMLSQYSSSWRGAE